MAIRDNTDWNAFERDIRNRMIFEYNRKAVKFLQQVGERVVKYARTDASNARHYTDRTGNLRNSIGYVVVQDGRIVESAFDGNTPPSTGSEKGKNGNQIGLAYATEIAKELSKFKTYLVWVAGMEYASYVEAKGYDVIQGSGDWLESIIEVEREKFKRYLLSNKQ